MKCQECGFYCLNESAEECPRCGTQYNIEIPDHWHKEYAYNCLTNEQFKELQDKVQPGDTFQAECDECGQYTTNKHHRCDCGNRRCYFQHGVYEGETFFYIAVD